MPLSGSVVRAPAGAKGFDTNTVLTTAHLSDLKSNGFTFCLRYISRGASEGSGDLSVAEANRILGAGFALMPVQHVAPQGWNPSGDLGTSNGQHAAAHATDIGFPAGVNVWVDLEGVAGGTPAQDIVDYCNAWFKEVEAAGFVPGIYVGPGAGLSPDDLFHRLAFKHYWRAGAGSTPNVSRRGFQMRQHLTTSINGLSIDQDDTQDDAMGDAVFWLAPS